MPRIRKDSSILRLIKDVNEIRSALRRVTVNIPLFDIANQNTPTQITANQNNYVIGNYDLLRLSSNQVVSITGLKGGIKGRFLRIFNIGSYSIKLNHQDTNSDAENRFLFSNGRDVSIPPGSNILIYYDNVQSRWIGGDSLSAGAVYASCYNSGSQLISSTVPTKLDPGTVVTDQYSFYDDANNRYVVAFDGFFVVRGMVKSNGSTGTTRNFYLYQGGAEVDADFREAGAVGILYHKVFIDGFFAKNTVFEFYASRTGANQNFQNLRTSIQRII